MSELEIGGLLILMWACGIYTGYLFGSCQPMSPTNLGGPNDV